MYPRTYFYDTEKDILYLYRKLESIKGLHPKKIICFYVPDLEEFANFLLPAIARKEGSIEVKPYDFKCANCGKYYPRHELIHHKDVPRAGDYVVPAGHYCLGEEYCKVFYCEECAKGTEVTCSNGQTTSGTRRIGIGGIDNDGNK